MKLDIFHMNKPRARFTSSIMRSIYYNEIKGDLLC